MCTTNNSSIESVFHNSVSMCRREIRHCMSWVEDKRRCEKETATLSLIGAASCYQANLGRERRDITADWLETLRGRGQRQRVYKPAQKGLRQCLQDSLRIPSAAALTPLLHGFGLCYALFSETSQNSSQLRSYSTEYRWVSYLMVFMLKQRCLYCLHSNLGVQCKTKVCCISDHH